MDKFDVVAEEITLENRRNGFENGKKEVGGRWYIYSEQYGYHRHGHYLGERCTEHILITLEAVGIEVPKRAHRFRCIVALSQKGEWEISQYGSVRHETSAHPSLKIRQLQDSRAYSTLWVWAAEILPTEIADYLKGKCHIYVEIEELD